MFLEIRLDSMGLLCLDQNQLNFETYSKFVRYMDRTDFLGVRRGFWAEEVEPQRLEDSTGQCI